MAKVLVERYPPCMMALRHNSFIDDLTMHNNNIGIREIATYIPAAREANSAKKERFGINDDFLSTKIGVEFVSRRQPDEETSDLCVSAFLALERKCQVTRKSVDCVVVVTQNPDGDGIPHTSAIIHGKLGLDDSCAAFDLSLGCSGYVYGLSVMQSFMRDHDLTCGLLFTADPYSKIVDPSDKNTALLFGDAATVTLLTKQPILMPVSFFFGTRGAEWSSLKCVNRVLSMNGRAVFNFSAVEVPIQIQKLLDKNGVGISEIDIFLLHQGSKYLVDTITRRMGLADVMVPSNLKSQGNTVSSSVPMLLEGRVHDPAVNRIVLSGFGVGLSWASAYIKRVS